MHQNLTNRQHFVSKQKTHAGFDMRIKSYEYMLTLPIPILQLLQLLQLLSLAER